MRQLNTKACSVRLVSRLVIQFHATNHAGMPVAYSLQYTSEHSIADLTEELVLLKQQLEDEKRLRLARQKFEESARRVNSMPSRDVLAGCVCASTLA